MFPQSGAAVHAECRRWLSQLLSEDAQQRQQALDPEQFERMIELLIAAAQLEVLKPRGPERDRRRGD